MNLAGGADDFVHYAVNLLLQLGADAALRHCRPIRLAHGGKLGRGDDALDMRLVAPLV
jgi:hypothetical protein